MPIQESDLRKILVGRISIFIDASNVFFINKRLRVSIDYSKVLQFFKSFDGEAKCYFYSAFQEDYQKQLDYFDELTQAGIVVKKKPLKFISLPKIKGKKKDVDSDDDEKEEGFYKGNMDVELVIDAIRLMSQYDTFVLFSGDSDFYALLKYLEEHNKNVVVLSRHGFVAEELRTIGHFIDIGDYLRKIPKQAKKVTHVKRPNRNNHSPNKGLSH
jgi:uncharacterized LabA/DUF88 family protein